MVKIIKAPSGDYYLMKSHGLGFMFIGRATGTEKGTVSLGSALATIPKELVGKKFALRVEFLEK